MSRFYIFICSFIFLFVQVKNCIATSKVSHFGLLLDNPMAYVSPRGRVELSYIYSKMNKTLDIFNARGGGTKGLDIGKAGDYTSYGGILNFGVTDHILFSFKGESTHIDYGSATVHITRLYPGIRFNIFPESGALPAISLGFKYRYDKGSNIKKSFSSITFENITIKFEKPQSITISDINDKDFQFSLLFSKSLTDRLIFHTFFSYTRINVESNFDTSLDIKEIKEVLKNVEYDSNKYTFGVGLHINPFSWMIASIYYKHYYLDTDIDDKIKDDCRNNDLVDLKFSFILSKHIVTTIFAKYFSNQLLGEIPFLYNPYSAKYFSHRYGYVGVILTYGWGY